MLMYSAKVEHVINVVTFVMFPFLKDYVSSIARHRSKAPSKVMQKTCKVTRQKLKSKRLLFPTFWLQIRVLHSFLPFSNYPTYPIFQNFDLPTTPTNHPQTHPQTRTSPIASLENSTSAQNYSWTRNLCHLLSSFSDVPTKTRSWTTSQ